MEVGKMKAIAMYLPQFHRTKENDEWWGEGFTEWTTVKNAEALYEGHYQPRVPLNDNYYNLLNKSVFQWQVELMKEFNVYGMCFYHYYFKNGKKILEKPAENLLEWKEIDMPFCFSWANETWSRTWSKLSSSNVWTSKFETDAGNNKEGVLLEQGYGTEREWKEHFDYLLPFFRDNRYIKKDGRPMFIIYKPEMIPCLSEMIDCWNKLAQNNGIESIYFVGTNIEVAGPLDAVLYQEPQYSMRYFEKKNQLNGREVWEQSLNHIGVVGQTTYYCGFPGYDDTPRRGKAGIALSIIEPTDFKNYFEKLVAKSESFGNEFVFINAWNEWGEGMYLEPDTIYRTEYLEAVKTALISGKQTAWKYSNEFLVDYQKLIARYKSYWTLLDKWLYKLENKHRIEEFFSQRNYNKVAIYGIGMIGKHLINQLDNDRIVYGIDKRDMDYNFGFPILKPDSDFPEADVIIVTTSYDFQQISKMLKTKVRCPVISIDSLIEEF